MEFDTIKVILDLNQKVKFLFYFNGLLAVFPLVCVLWPLTGKPLIFLSPRYDLIKTKFFNARDFFFFKSLVIIIFELPINFTNFLIWSSDKFLVFKFYEKPKILHKL